MVNFMRIIHHTTIILCTFVLLACTAATRAALVSHYPFNGQPSQNIYNTTGPNATLIGQTDQSYQPSTAGHGANYGNAIHLTGKDDHAALGRMDLFNFNQDDFSITGWFRHNKLTGKTHRMIFDNAQHNQGGAGIILFRANSGKGGHVLFEVKGTNKHNVGIFSDMRLDDDQWHFVSAVVKNKTLSLYIDGKLQSSQATYHPNTTATPPTTKRASLGKNFIGSLDDISIFNHALSQNDIDDLHKNGLTSFGYTPDTQPPTQITTSENRIKIKEHLAFDGHTGWPHNNITYRLACAPIITQAQNGDLLVAWLSGSAKEPATDNCVLIARSSDLGKTWSKPKILIPAGKQASALTNMFTTENGQIVVLGAYWPSEDLYTIWNYFRMTSDDHGKTWSSKTPLNFRSNRASLGHRFKLQNGQYFYPGSTFTARDKPLIAPVTKLAYAKTEAQAAAMPEAEGKKPGKFGTHLHGCQGFTSNDDVTTFNEHGEVANRPLGLLEPTAVQLDDGTIVMLMRAEWGGFLWRSDSKDNGKTWSPAVQTDIPNPSSLIALIKLPDSRIALIHNPSGGIPGERGPRDPIAIWISDDQLESWSIKQDIIFGGKLAYPHPIIIQSGKLVFAYDHNRRQVRFVTVELPPANN
ncbi:exo-alpha-sialidase [Poriferisphaera sp. WC338]|uniref:exo-alpha-sialidase n=1 Tax=Poriferisphaera sp. WC338 TaxID=3425129 RepID=UPI003D815CD8